MFNKLYQDGVEGDMWSLMNNMYNGMTFKVKWDNNLTDNINIAMTSVFPGFSFTRSRLVLYCTTPSMACISVLGPSSTISSVHAGEATPVSPNLFNKLYQDGVEGDMWSLMNNMYNGMTFKVKWDNNLTDNINIAQVIRQGAKHDFSFSRI
jgi:hypothetical protein